MDRNQFRSNEIKRQHLRQFIEDPIVKEAFEIIRLEHETVGVPLDAPEISSVRAWSLMRGAKAALDTLRILTTVNKEAEDSPALESQYQPETYEENA